MNIKDARKILLENNFDNAIAELKNFGITEEIFKNTPIAKKFLESLPALPMNYTEPEKPLLKN